MIIVRHLKCYIVCFDICCQADSVATQTIGQHHVQFLFLIVVVVTAGESVYHIIAFSVDQVQPGFPSDELSDWASELLLADQDGLLELASPQESVQGRLKSHSSFWSNELKPSVFVEDIVLSGYRLPFVSYPDLVVMRNHPSTLVEKEFVSAEIDSLVAASCAIESCVSLCLQSTVGCL